MIVDFGVSWSPNSLTVAAGTNVTWAWVGFHDLRSDSGLWSPVPATNNGSFNFTFNTPGEYGYYCGQHGAPGVGMAGKIYVVAPPTATATPTLVQGATAELELRAFGNPQRGPTLRFVFRMGGTADLVKVKLYTPAMAVVGLGQAGGPVNGAWTKLSLDLDGFNGGLAYAQAEAYAQGAKVAESKPVRLYVIP